VLHNACSYLKEQSYLTMVVYGRQCVKIMQGYGVLSHDVHTNLNERSSVGSE
jgi:hypothetical protein